MVQKPVCFFVITEHTMSISTANCHVVRRSVVYRKPHNYLIVLHHSISQVKNGFQLYVQQHKAEARSIF